MDFEAFLEDARKRMAEKAAREAARRAKVAERLLDWESVAVKAMERIRTSCAMGRDPAMSLFLSGFSDPSFIPAEPEVQRSGRWDGQVSELPSSQDVTVRLRGMGETCAVSSLTWRLERSTSGELFVVKESKLGGWPSQESEMLRNTAASRLAPYSRTSEFAADICAGVEMAWRGMKEDARASAAFAQALELSEKTERPEGLARRLRFIVLSAARERANRPALEEAARGFAESMARAGEALLGKPVTLVPLPAREGLPSWRLEAGDGALLLSPRPSGENGFPCSALTRMEPSGEWRSIHSWTQAEEDFSVLARAVAFAQAWRENPVRDDWR